MIAAQAQPDAASIAREAKAALEARNFDRAATLYGQLCRQMPGVAGLRLNLAMGLFWGGGLENAPAAFRGAVQLDASLTPASFFLGVSRARVGRPSEAIEPLERVLRAEPASPVALLESADAHL